MRNGVDEVFFPFEIASQPIRPQHLQKPEQHEAHEVRAERLVVEVQQLIQCLHVFVNQRLAQALRIARRGLPEEGSHIVLQRALLSALKVYEIRFAIEQHDIARLKIAVEEGALLWRARRQVRSQRLKVCLQPHLIHGQVRSAQEAVFEIVEVEHRRLLVELLGRQEF